MCDVTSVVKNNKQETRSRVEISNLFYKNRKFLFKANLCLKITSGFPELAEKNATKVNPGEH